MLLAHEVGPLQILKVERALEAPRLAENPFAEPLQGEVQGGGGRGLSGKAAFLS